jgi:hypothetical protein
MTASLSSRPWIYGWKVEYEETYQGRRVVVTTTEGTEGTWTSQVEFLDDGERVAVADAERQTHTSEDEARRAGFSAAAAAIDRARASQGKP